jgi:hypothetical protein
MHHCQYPLDVFFKLFVVLWPAYSPMYPAALFPSFAQARARTCIGSWLVFHPVVSGYWYTDIFLFIFIS